MQLYGVIFNYADKFFFFYFCSIFVLRSVVIPTLQWVLPDGCPQINPQESCPFGGIFRFYSFLRLGLIQLFYVSADFCFIVICKVYVSGKISHKQGFTTLFMFHGILLLSKSTKPRDSSGQVHQCVWEFLVFQVFLLVSKFSISLFLNNMDFTLEISCNGFLVFFFSAATMRISLAVFFGCLCESK